MIIETDRLILRELKQDDFSALAEIFTDPETMKYYPAPYDLCKVQKIIDWNLANYEKYGFGLWAVVLKTENILIGDCGITYQNIDGTTLPEIGYHFNKKYFNNGYATEAAQACKKYAFEVLKLETIYSYMTSDNIASQRVAQKNGMKLIKEYEENGEKNKVYAISLKV